MNFEYTLKKSFQARGIRIKINHNGSVMVTAPKLIPETIIKDFLHKQEAWILKNLAKIKQKSVKTETESDIYLFGQKYPKVFLENQNKTDIKIGDNQVIISFHGQKIDYQKKMAAFLKKIATNYILTRSKQISERMQIKYNKITLKLTSSRWGSCSSTGNLNFNYRLVHAPTKTIDYVIIHELAHRKEMNHSAAFWNLVRQFCPDYPLHKNYLQKQMVTS